MSGSHPKPSRRPSSSDLSRWFASARNHDKAALQQLLALYRPLLIKVAHQRLRGALRAKVAPSDLVQATLWKATQNFSGEEFEGRKGFLAWLITILKNEAADVRRRFVDAQKRDISRERPLFSAETQDWLNQLSASLSASDASRSARRETVEQLMSALRRLPPHYQLVVRLRYYEKLDFGAIGDRLERSYNAARILHNRALKRLRDELNIERDADDGASR